MKIKDILVISGSTLGFIATILGIVAVFYPDLLNLQKKTIDGFSMEAFDSTDAKNFDSFLYKNRNEIVKLDISICKSKIATSTSSCTKITQDYNSLHFDFIGMDTNGNPACGKGESLKGMIFKFNDQDSQNINGKYSQIWTEDNWDECIKMEGVGKYKISHYFLVPDKANFSQGWVYWTLTPIDAKELKLKNY